MQGSEVSQGYGARHGENMPAVIMWHGDWCRARGGSGMWGGGMYADIRHVVEGSHGRGTLATCGHAAWGLTLGFGVWCVDVWHGGCMAWRVAKMGGTACWLQPCGVALGCGRGCVGGVVHRCVWHAAAGCHAESKHGGHTPLYNSVLQLASDACILHAHSWHGNLWPHPSTPCTPQLQPVGAPYVGVVSWPPPPPVFLSVLGLWAMHAQLAQIIMDRQAEVVRLYYIRIGSNMCLG